MRCIKCGKRAFSELCFRCKPRKPIAKIGKQGKKTAAAVAKWKRTQKPTHEGYFICFYCGHWVEYLQAEHKLSKARHQDKRTDPQNLVPACSECNERKRSKDYGVDWR